MLALYNWFSDDIIGISLFNLVRNLLYLVVVAFIMTQGMNLVFQAMNKSIGVNFKENVWNDIKKGNMAVAVYFGLRVFGVLIAAGMVAAAFIK